MYSSIQSFCDDVTQNFNSISQERKEILDKITEYVRSKVQANKAVQLVYVCTHNSRRSHFGQVWAHVASRYYAIPNVSTFSGGTEATAFNINAINALKKIGFEVKQDGEKNPLYKLYFDEQESAIECFSKVYNDAKNPQKDFAAIMTCSDAEDNCPFIPGVELRIATTYNDPKAFDNTPLQDEKYSERCKQIATEIFYLFSKVK